MFAEDLKELGWVQDEEGFWSHSHRPGKCGEAIALELEETIQARDTLNETLKQQRWKDGEAGVDYVLLSNPPFLFHSPWVDRFKDLPGALEAVFEELEDKSKDVGTLIYSLVSKKHDKVKFPNGNECNITEYYINTLFKWDGKKWINVFGNIRELKGMG